MRRVQLRSRHAVRLLRNDGQNGVIIDGIEDVVIVFISGFWYRRLTGLVKKTFFTKAGDKNGRIHEKHTLRQEGFGSSLHEPHHW